MRKRLLLLGLWITACAVLTQIHAQSVGVLTDTPQGPFHVASSGQVNTPGGLVILGDTSEGHLQMDFNLLQAFYDNTPLLLQLQPEGGDLRVGSNLLQIDASEGFVGIGTTDPLYPLHIAGNADQFLAVHNTAFGGLQSGIDLLRYSAFGGTDWRIVNDGGILKFLDGTDNFDSAGQLNMVITQGGNVGIGTESPASRLHVANSGDEFLTVQNTAFGGAQAGIDLLRYTEFGGTDWRIVNDGGVLKFLDGTDNFDSAGELNMVITQGGNVGIGIASPGAPLNVNGSEFVNETGSGHLNIGSPTGTHLRFDNNEILARNGDNPSLLYLQYWSGNLSLCFDNDGRVGVGTTAPNAKMHITDGTDVNLTGGGELVLGNTNTQNLALDGNEIQARNNQQASHLFLQVSGGDVLMVPNETGQVGIGVTSSANMPSNDYLLAVDGKIISEEVRVEISGSWPDYVFAENYPLLSLDALEKEINARGHLPGIPDAETIAEEGVALGEMQRVMMEKIEELTLYVIDLQKQIEALKGRQ